MGPEPGTCPKAICGACKRFVQSLHGQQHGNIQATAVTSAKPSQIGCDISMESYLAALAGFAFRRGVAAPPRGL